MSHPYWQRGYRESPFPEINADIQLFVSNSLSGEAGDPLNVTPGEMIALLGALDLEIDNTLGASEKDLELVFNYLSDAGVYDDGFEVFPYCVDPPGSIPLAERNHVDLYLVMYGKDSKAGTYTSTFTDTLEDHPDTACASPCTTYHFNAFQVTDGRNDQSGNAIGDSLGWPVAAAQAACHEFSHMLWKSNSYPYIA